MRASWARRTPMCFPSETVAEAGVRCTLCKWVQAAVARPKTSVPPSGGTAALASLGRTSGDGWSSRLPFGEQCDIICRWGIRPLRHGHRARTRRHKVGKRSKNAATRSTAAMAAIHGAARAFGIILSLLVLFGSESARWDRARRSRSADQSGRIQVHG